MSLHETFGQPLLTFPDAEKSPLSIRAKALVFVDPRSRQLREELESLAPRALPVLIRGETGSGKELLARHIHRGSDRTGLFVSVNCGAISPTYADAELFGYAAGAHSGAASSRAGWFGSANGGTLYLDEIGDLPLPIQVKLLAALENHEVTRVGAHQPSPVDVRLVAATSIDLAQAVAAGKFHEATVPLLERRPTGLASAARAGRRYPFVGRIFPGHLQPAPGPAGTVDQRRCPASPGAPQLAGQYARAGERYSLCLAGQQRRRDFARTLNLPVAGSPVEQLQRIFNAASPAEQESLRKFLYEQNGIST